MIHFKSAASIARLHRVWVLKSDFCIINFSEYFQKKDTGVSEI
jgi:translation initiation factor IF-1